MKKEDLRIIFMGTPEFAVETLRALLDNGFNVVAVVTQPDKPVGRHGSVLQPSAVKQYAEAHGLPVLQPVRMKDEAFVSKLESFKANLQVVVAFRMLPEVVWAMPEYGTFNVHAALLPQYRGAAPINWAVMNGETVTGVTTFFLDREIDTGRVIMREEFEIKPEFNAGDVYDGLMRLGAEVCLKTLDRIIETGGHPEAIPQSELTVPGEELRQAPKIFKETCRIDWNKPAAAIHNFVRGLSPSPGAWTTMTASDGRQAVLKIYSTALTDLNVAEPQGTFVTSGRKIGIVAAGGSVLEVCELQLSGKKRMGAADFLNGLKDPDGCRVE